MRVLITNDDGPPSGTGGHSPFIYPFARALMTHLNWDVRVVVPASQRSWVGKSYLIAEKVTGAYYYPRGEDGTEGERRELPRPIGEGEMEWILLDGTPGEYSVRFGFSESIWKTDSVPPLSLEQQLAPRLRCITCSRQILSTSSSPGELPFKRSTVYSPENSLTSPMSDGIQTQLWPEYLDGFCSILVSFHLPES